MTKHLWEAKHPYYMNEGNYYSNDCHGKSDTWGEFLSEFGDCDMDYNYVVRWDWLDGEDWDCPYTGDDYYRNGRLLIQFVGQRKARLFSHEVSVCRADEAAVREWLKPRFRYAVAMWEPFTVGGSDA